jgi:FlaA1/EpsC-like NDP-sugar epimerase
MLASKLSPRRSRSPRFRVALGSLRYGPAFALQVSAFFLILVAGEIIYSGTTGNRDRLAVGLLLVALAMGAAEMHFKLYKRVWAVAGLADALALALAVIEASALITLANLLIPPTHRPFPSAVPLLVAPIVLSVIAGYRLLPRLRAQRPIGENRLLIVVPDDSAYGTVKSLVQSSNTLWTAIGIVTHRSVDARRTVMGIPIVGDTNNLGHWVKVTNADGVAFVHSETGVPDFGSLVSVCLDLEKPIFIIPTSRELFRSPGASRLRQLSADDLIAQSPLDLQLDSAAHAIKDRIVLVTGAAGSVGSELCRTLVSMNPSRIVLVDNNESGLFDIAAELRAISRVDVHEALVSITDRELLLTVFKDEKPELVFHAAAYKHVPMLESHPEQAIMVNVVGTKNALWCAEAVSTQHFVLISTDKAASTDSVMGCTKRLCELLVLSYGGSMHCRAVRFGNVVGSRGSVIPTFERQIQRGGPVTITHPEMTRYMMTAHQAAALVIGTVLLPPSRLYMLDMAEPIRILDIANALIRARGLRPGKDIEVVFTGLRRGERLSENLLGPDEGWRPTDHPSVREVVTPMPGAPEDLLWTLQRLTELAQEQKTTELTRTLRRAVWRRSAPPTDERIVASADPLEADVADQVKFEGDPI